MEAGGHSCWCGSGEWKLGDNHVLVEMVNGSLEDNHVGVEVVNGSWGTIMLVWKW